MLASDYIFGSEGKGFSSLVFNMRLKCIVKQSRLLETLLKIDCLALVIPPSPPHLWNSEILETFQN